MLKVEHISTGYGKKQVLYDVSFEVNEGEVVLLTGGNGSGKSTVFKCIYNLLPLWNGEIFFNSEHIKDFRSNDLIKRGIVYIPQKDNMFMNLSLQNNLELFGNIYNKKDLKRKIEKVFSMLPILSELRSRTPFYLSGGEKQILCCGMAMIHNPRLILFDEPLAGLSEQNSENILQILTRIKKEGTSLLIIDHQKEKISFLDKKYELYQGRIKI